jgi:alkanesulfonate monooxygenase SsuD/methylene tetrahydromethanopterin reductase-like flavin-dependent oxidoreductase (luciferase family)
MAKTLHIGVQLPEVETTVRWTDLRDIAITAEDVGFDSIWVGDHLLYRDADGARGPWEAWSTLAALAAVTSRVQLGPLVAATAFHNPAILAKTASTIDEISDGRLIVGLGAGWNRTEFDAFGFPYDHRASRFEEAFTIIRTLLSDGSIDFDGDFYTLRDCELQPPVRPGGPPILIGSNGPRMLAMTLPHVRMWNTWYGSYGNTPEGLEALVAEVNAIGRTVGVDADDVVKTAAVLIEAPAHLGNPDRRKRVGDPPAVVGDPAVIAERLLAFAAAGVAHVQLVVDPITAASVAWLGAVIALLDR